ncbi:hypothetical protein [Mycobacterium sp. HM-7]
MAQKRYPRRLIDGLPDSWEVNEAGHIFHHRRKQSVEMFGDMPAVDFKGEYLGWVPMCSARPNNHDMRGEPHNYGPTFEKNRTEANLELVRLSRFRLVDEIVCTSFHGLPKSWATADVVHIDGDMGNCAAENLRWSENADAIYNKQLKKFATYHTPTYGKQGTAKRMGRFDPIYTPAQNPLIFVNGYSVADYQPVSPKGSTIA